MLECTTVEITLAHSPDSDDAFMFFALTAGKIDTGEIRFHFILKDIDSLNRAAESVTYDVTAISFAAYPALAPAYQLLSCGASLGRGHGPVIVAHRQMNRQELAHTRIAVPGRRTSAYLALTLYLGSEPQTEEVPFDRVMEDVVAGRFAAGVLIHEGQITYAQHKLECVADLGNWWQEETGLPLPLGANAIRRSLPQEMKSRIAGYIQDSIRYALANPKEALDFALQFGRGISRQETERFIRMYVNEFTLELGARGRHAVETFLMRASPEEKQRPRLTLEFVAPK